MTETTLKNELHKLVLASLVQSDMRLASRNYIAGWGLILGNTKWGIAPTVIDALLINGRMKCQSI